MIFKPKEFFMAGILLGFTLVFPHTNTAAGLGGGGGGDEDAFLKEVGCGGGGGGNTSITSVLVMFPKAENSAKNRVHFIY